MAVILSKKELDEAGCDTPSCGHDHKVIFFHSDCHPERPVVVRYEKPRGLVMVSCSVCGMDILGIVPGERKPQLVGQPHG
jgi:hypothetical protein